jgi:hypothetical protein
MHFASLYERYDAILIKDAEEKKKMASRSRMASTAEEAKRKALLLERKRERLSELPAFSSMLHIEEVENELMEPSGAGEDALEEERPKMDGFERMRQCRLALDALDVAGWKRSYHQRMFHEAYIAACARPFWKLDPPGSFARAHQKILDFNNWDNLAQEILISTPRRYQATLPSHAVQNPK